MAAAARSAIRSRPNPGGRSNVRPPGHLPASCSSAFAESAMYCFSRTVVRNFHRRLRPNIRKIFRNAGPLSIRNVGAQKQAQTMPLD